MSNKELKVQAKASLKPAVFKAIVITICVIVINAVLNKVLTGFWSALSTFITSIINVGVIHFYMKLVVGDYENAGVGDLFAGFKIHPEKTIALCLLHTIVMLPGVIFPMLGTIVAMFGNNLTLSASLASVGAIMGVIYSLWVSLTYGLAFYILLDNPEDSVLDIWKQSAVLMKGNRFRLVKLVLSFIPWILLVAVTLGIAGLYVIPYMSITMAYFYVDLAWEDAVA